MCMYVSRSDLKWHHPTRRRRSTRTRWVAIWDYFVI